MTTLFNSLYLEGTSTLDLYGFIICTVVSLVLGGIISWTYMFKNQYSKGFVITIFLLPAMVQMVIMLVNGSVGTGLAVVGAFSLVRFRSVPGTAKEISSIFLSMAVGLGTGMGYVGFSSLFTVIICCVMVVLNTSNFGEMGSNIRVIRITIPENLDYMTIFDDIFDQYLKKAELIEVKTTNMGSLFRLEYIVEIKNPLSEKKLIDILRTKNGNLEISCSHGLIRKEAL